MNFLNNKIPPPIILLLSGLAIWLLRNEGALPIKHEVKAILGGGFVVLGIAFDLFGLMEFQKFKTTINPLNPNKTRAFVQTGIYSRTRNPMYLGMVFLLVGWSIINKASFGILIIPLFMKYIETFQIIPEEKILTEKFGKKYQDYCEKTGRWI